MDLRSSLSHIENEPETPMDLFKRFLSEFKENSCMPYVPINVASLNSQYGILNRTVVFRGIDDTDVVFVTERNTQKYKDLKEDPTIAATFLFVYQKDERTISRQIRINGIAQELSPDKLPKLWNEESTVTKIRSYICECGKPIDWNTVKEKHDTLLKKFQEGKADLKQTETYTAFRILANTIDFYHAKDFEIADRLVYRRKDNIWIKERVYT